VTDRPRSLAWHSRRLDPPIERRRLQRLLAAAERRAGRRIGIRRGERRIWWLVTEADLRRYLPGLFGHARRLDELESATRSVLASVERRAEETAREVARAEVAAERRDREAGDERCAALVLEVAETVKAVGVRVTKLELLSAGNTPKRGQNKAI
jgi:hypothetical protein